MRNTTPWLLLLALAAAGCGSTAGDQGRTPGGGGPDQGGPGPCPRGNSVLGIDVSVYQGSIDWKAVKGAGLAFGIARVSDGLQHPDSTFAANWAGMKAAGLIRGAYQYFEPAQDPLAQASLVVSRVGHLGSGDLPVMLDVEMDGGLSPGEITAAIRAWVAAVREGTGKLPMIYTGAYFWNNSVGSTEFARLPLVIASWSTSCPGLPNAWSDWTFQQYSNSESIPGMVGRVDGEVFNGAQPELFAMAASPAEEDLPGVAPDFDGDGYGDLLGIGTDGTLNAYYNLGTQGHPLFGDWENIDSGWHRWTAFDQIAVLDADHDTRPDLLGIWADGSVTVYLNTSSRGAIRFATPVEVGLGWTGIVRLAVADVDADGRRDLVAILLDGTLVAFLNQGTPGHPDFGPPWPIETGWQDVTRIVVVDGDNDGREDLMAVRTDGTMSAHVSLGTPGNPRLGARKDIGVGWNGITRIAVVDADSDGKNDLAGTWTSGQMTAYRNMGSEGDPLFGDQKDIGAGWQGITQIVVVDADQDGKKDLLGIWADGTLSAYTNLGTTWNPSFGNKQDIGSGWDNIARIATVH